MCNLTLQRHVITLSEREPKARSDLGQMTARKRPNKVALVWINLKRATRFIATLVITHPRSCRGKDHQPRVLCQGRMHQVSSFALFPLAPELLVHSRNVPGRIDIQVACMQSPFSSLFPSAFPSLPLLSPANAGLVVCRMSSGLSAMASNSNSNSRSVAVWLSIKPHDVKVNVPADREAWPRIEGSK